MGRPARFTFVSDEDDQLLRELELNPVVHPKVRLRASILRLHRIGMTVQELSAHFGRNHQAIHNDLERYEQQGIAGLADAQPPGQRSKFTPEIQQFLHEKLAEDRLWNAPLLCDAVHEKFGVDVGKRAMAKQLLSLGYRWKRARYSPAKPLDPEVAEHHRASIETLKRGHWTAN